MASDVVRVICPNLKCKAILSVPGTARGKTVRCRQCGTRVGIPEILEKPVAVPVGPDAQSAQGGAPSTPTAQ
ncbi:MAG: hypothetical protein HC898_07685 [Phycisphaerales bacterium]|nr:hypothetical protein [Phycisphaerales bacterium]